MADRDFVDELVEEATEKNPEFPKLVGAAVRRRRLMRTLAEQRRARASSQTAIAAQMGSSQSAVARLEGSSDDALISTVDRYALAVGYEIQYHLVPKGSLDSNTAVVVHS